MNNTNKLSRTNDYQLNHKTTTEKYKLAEIRTLNEK